MNPTHFKHLAKVIAEAFPSEVAETYFIPAKKPQAPGGKLFSQYNNYRTSLASVGLIQRRQRSRQETVIVQSEITEEIITALAHVKGSDWEDTQFFFDCWDSSYQERSIILASDISTKDYIEQFPYTLQSDIGYELVRNFKSNMILIISSN